MGDIINIRKSCINLGAKEVAISSILPKKNITDKHWKGRHGNIGVLISDSSTSPEKVSDISNLGSVSSNWNSRNVKDYDKNSSDPRLALENLSLKIIGHWSQTGHWKSYY